MRQVASLPPRSRASTPPATACCAAALYLCPWSPLWTHPQPRPPRISAKTPRTRLSQQGGPHRRETNGGRQGEEAGASQVAPVRSEVLLGLRKERPPGVGC